MDLAHYTTGLGSIKKGDIESLKIPIPSLEQQREIVEFCEANDRLIKQLEKEIEQNEKFAKTIIQDAFAGLESADETKKRKHCDV